VLGVDFLPREMVITDEIAAARIAVDAGIG
jgi:hypothetical protein